MKTVLFITYFTYFLDYESSWCRRLLPNAVPSQCLPQSSCNYTRSPPSADKENRKKRAEGRQKRSVQENVAQSSTRRSRKIFCELTKYVQNYIEYDSLQDYGVVLHVLQIAYFQ